MADVELTGPKSKSQALTTSYLGAGSRYIVRGHRVTVACDDAAIGMVVKMWPKGDNSVVGDSDVYEEIVAASLPFVEDLHHQSWYLDVKAASGTPNCKIKVS